MLSKKVLISRGEVATFSSEAFLEYINLLPPTKNSLGDLILTDETSTFSDFRPEVYNKVLYLDGTNNYGEAEGGSITFDSDTIDIWIKPDVGYVDWACIVFGSNEGDLLYKIVLHDDRLRIGSFDNSYATIGTANHASHIDSDEQFDFTNGEWWKITVEKVAITGGQRVNYMVNDEVVVQYEMTDAEISTEGYSMAMKFETIGAYSSAFSYVLKFKGYIGAIISESIDESFLFEEYNYFPFCYNRNEDKINLTYSSITSIRVEDNDFPLLSHSGDIAGIKVSGRAFNRDAGFEQVLTTSQSLDFSDGGADYNINGFNGLSEWSMFVDATMLTTSGFSRSLFELTNRTSDSVLSIERATNGIWVNVTGATRFGQVGGGYFSIGDRITIFAVGTSTEGRLYINGSLVHSYSDDYTIPNTGPNSFCCIGIGSKTSSIYANSPTTAFNARNCVIHRAAIWKREIELSEIPDLEDTSLDEWDNSQKSDLVEAWHLSAQNTIEGILGEHTLYALTQNTYDISNNSPKPSIPSGIGLCGEEFTGRISIPVKVYEPTLNSNSGTNYVNEASNFYIGDVTQIHIFLRTSSSATQYLFDATGDGYAMRELYLYNNNTLVTHIFEGGDRATYRDEGSDVGNGSGGTIPSYNDGEIHKLSIIINEDDDIIYFRWDDSTVMQFSGYGTYYAGICQSIMVKSDGTNHFQGDIVAIVDGDGNSLMFPCINDSQVVFQGDTSAPFHTKNITTSSVSSIYSNEYTKGWRAYQGFDRYTKVSSEDIYVPLDNNGNSISYTPPSGYSLEGKYVPGLYSFMDPKIDLPLWRKIGPISIVDSSMPTNFDFIRDRSNKLSRILIRVTYEHSDRNFPAFIFDFSVSDYIQGDVAQDWSGVTIILLKGIETTSSEIADFTIDTVNNRISASSGDDSFAYMELSNGIIYVYKGDNSTTIDNEGVGIDGSAVVSDIESNQGIQDYYDWEAEFNQSQIIKDAIKYTQ